MMTWNIRCSVTLAVIPVSERGRQGKCYHPAHVVIVFIPFTVISETTSAVLDQVYKSHPLPVTTGASIILKFK